MWLVQPQCPPALLPSHCRLTSEYQTPDLLSGPWSPATGHLHLPFSLSGAPSRFPTPLQLVNSEETFKPVVLGQGIICPRRQLAVSGEVFCRHSQTMRAAGIQRGEAGMSHSILHALDSPPQRTNPPQSRQWGIREAQIQISVPMSLPPRSCF